MTLYCWWEAAAELLRICALSSSVLEWGCAIWCTGKSDRLCAGGEKLVYCAFVD
ncbi:MAG: hypothetical protein ACKESB_03270 [Candidatus Hodgkinia cicadicola]